MLHISSNDVLMMSEYITNGSAENMSILLAQFLNKACDTEMHRRKPSRREKERRVKNPFAASKSTDGVVRCKRYKISDTQILFLLPFSTVGEDVNILFSDNAVGFQILSDW